MVVSRGALDLNRRQQRKRRATDMTDKLLGHFPPLLQATRTKRDTNHTNPTRQRGNPCRPSLALFDVALASKTPEKTALASNDVAT